MTTGFPGGKNNNNNNNSLANAADIRYPGSIPGLRRTLEEGTAPHSSTFAWRIPWTEEPGRLQSIGSQRVGHNWSDLTRTHTCIHDYSAGEWARTEPLALLMWKPLQELPATWKWTLGWYTAPVMTLSPYPVSLHTSLRLHLLRLPSLVHEVSTCEPLAHPEHASWHHAPQPFLSFLQPSTVPPYSASPGPDPGTPPIFVDQTQAFSYLHSLFPFLTQAFLVMLSLATSLSLRYDSECN